MLVFASLFVCLLDYLLMFRIVFWDVLRQYIPEDNSELHTRRRENLKSHIFTDALSDEKIMYY
jgi:hypothetical protein